MPFPHLDLYKTSLCPVLHKISQSFCSPKNVRGATQAESEGTHDGTFPCAIRTDDDVQSGSREELTVVISDEAPKFDADDAVRRDEKLKTKAIRVDGSEKNIQTFQVGTR